jgi:hypothetical protein
MSDQSCQNINEDDEDLGNYITQVVIDIGHVADKQKLLDQFKKASIANFCNITNNNLRWKMASVKNPSGVSPEEYGKFAIHVIQYLSFIKGLLKPTDQEIVDSGKIVNVERRKENSKFWIFLTLIL